MAEQFQTDAVLDELCRASDTGETRSRAQLQAACAIGSGDLDAVLTELHQGGLISQVAPDEWDMEEQAGSGDRPVQPGEPERAGPPIAGMPPRRPFAVHVTDDRGAGAAQVSMPRAVANVMDSGALGQLLKAGIDTTEPGETFVFEVTP